MPPKKPIPAPAGQQRLLSVRAARHAAAAAAAAGVCPARAGRSGAAGGGLAGFAANGVPRRAAPGAGPRADGGPPCAPPRAKAAHVAVTERAATADVLAQTADADSAAHASPEPQPSPAPEKAQETPAAVPRAV